MRLPRITSTALLALLAPCALLTGCEGVPTYSLRPPASTTDLVLHREVRWSAPVALRSSRWHFILVAGTYRPVASDDDGTFYVGPEPSCIYKTYVAADEEPVGNSQRCAIHVPNVASAPAEVYWINDGFYKQMAFDTRKSPIVGSIGPHYSSTGQRVDVKVVGPNGGPVAPNQAVAAGAGGAIGGGIVNGILAAEEGRFMKNDGQPDAGWLAAARAE
jgi:hypothetical protein